MLARSNLNPNLKKKVKAGDTVLVNSSGSPMLHIKKIKNDWALYSKVTGKKHIIPLLKNLEPPIAHQIPKHMEEIECSTCHARWTATDWGMHVIREKSFVPGKWKNWNLSDPLNIDPSNENSGMLYPVGDSVDARNAEFLLSKSLPKR